MINNLFYNILSGNLIVVRTLYMTIYNINIIVSNDYII